MSKAETGKITAAKGKIEKEAENWLGPMREATHEEQQSVENYIKSISVNTGVKFFLIYTGDTDEELGTETTEGDS